jgi:hypothetical protein
MHDAGRQNVPAPISLSCKPCIGFARPARDRYCLRRGLMAPGWIVDFSLILVKLWRKGYSLLHFNPVYLQISNLGAVMRELLLEGVRTVAICAVSFALAIFILESTLVMLDGLI